MIVAWLTMAIALSVVFLVIVVYISRETSWWPWGTRLGESIAWLVCIATLVATSPLVVRALDAVRQLTWPNAEARHDDLTELSPGLRGLIADARALRVALENGDEAMLREVWGWQRRLEQLGESDRRELGHLGLAEPGIADILKWTIAEPDRTHRGVTAIREVLEQFERRLLDSNSVFRGPFR